MDRCETNRMLEPLNFTTVLIYNKSDDYDMVVKAELVADKYRCEGQNELWSDDMPPIMDRGCDEVATWSLWAADGPITLHQMFCTSCLMERLRSGEFVVVSGAVTLDFDKESH